MHNEANYKQDEKVAFGMRENNSEWSKWQRITKIYKQHMQLNTRKINDSIKKLTKELGDHFTIHTRVESLCHLPRSNIVLEVTYALIIMWVSEFASDQFSSVTQSRPTPCNPMDCRTPGFPVHHKLPELAQTHVHWFRDAIQPSHSLLSPSPPAFNLSQHEGLFQWVSSSHQVTKVLELQL